MKLSEVFELLQYGELSNVSLSGGIDETKGIRAKDYPRLISHINLALTDLHTRFNLREREVIVQQQEDIVFYKLHSDFAQSNTDSIEPNKYIHDEVVPFEDNILRVNAIYDEQGCELPINDENRNDSLFLSNFRTIQVPFPTTNTMFVMCKTNHPKLALDTTDLDIEIEIPVYLQEALICYVAHRVHSQRNGQEAQVSATNLLARYEMLCHQVEDKNLLQNNPDNSNFKLGDRGWV